MPTDPTSMSDPAPSGPERLDAADVAALSALLDEAMELPSEAVPAWLARLSGEQARLAPRLRRMLARRTGVVGSFLSGAAQDLVAGNVPQPGERVGPYRLIRELGTGGMGTVWMAERDDGALRRRVALKLPRLAWGDAGLADRMARERDIGALLEHPNIARLYDAGVDEAGRPFIAFEAIDGLPLDRWWRESGASLPARLRLFVEVARAVAYAHGRLVVHRDLKPSNILVDPEGRAHLLDFGIAKLLDDSRADITRDHGRMLTPHYAAPEQLRGEPARVSSDIWSLGVLLFELLTGRLPFPVTTAGTHERASLDAEAPKASRAAPDSVTARHLRGDLDAIIAKALQPLPERRYATADALADDLVRHLEGERVLAQPDRASYRLRKALRRHWIGVTATACVAIAVLGGATTTAIQARKALQASERERVVREFVAEMFHANAATDGPASASPAARVEGGARLIQTRFQGEPALQAELYGVVADVFLDMGANRLAAQYAAHQLDSLVTAQAPGALRDAATLRRAQALYEDQHYPEAEALLRPLADAPGTSPPAAEDAQILLARTWLRTHRRAELQSMLQTLERPGAAASTRQAWAQAIRAQLASTEDLATAPAGFDLAIGTALSAEGPHSQTALEVRLLAAAALCRSADEQLANAYLDAAEAEMLSRGGAFVVRAALERARLRWSCAGVGKGSATVALAAIGRSRDALERSALTPPALLFQTLDFWEGTLRAQKGDLSTLPRLVAAAEALVKDASPGQRHSLGFVVGPALSSASRGAEGIVWLKAALAGSRQTWGAGNPIVTWDHLAIAGSHLDSGRPDLALDQLDEAERELSPKAEQRFFELARDAIAGMRASALLAAGRAPDALEALTPYFHGDSGSSDAWRRNVDLLWMGQPWGEALCALHRPREGLPHLLAGIARLEALDAADVDPATARQRAVAGACALDLGRIALARQLAGKARAAFDRQPEVAAPYKAPLQALEERLRGQA